MPSRQGRVVRAQSRSFRSAEREAERCKLAIPGDRRRGHRRTRWQWGVVAAAILPLLGCVTYPTELVPATPSAETAPDLYHPTLEAEYRIEAGDNLLIQSYYDPLLKQTATVRPDGRISLLLVGDIQAASKTPSELRDELLKQYGKYLDHPDLTVTVAEVSGLAVYVGGEVKSPSIETMKGSLTLLQSIVQAGGFLPSANKQQVLVLRQAPDGKFRAFQHDISKVLQNQEGEIYLRRRDIVYVPKSQIAQVNEFVDQYINQVLPKQLYFNLGYTFQDLQNQGTTVVK